MQEIDKQNKRYPDTKKLLKRGIILLIITTVIVSFLPTVVTRWSWIPLKVHSPNEIGDAIGGILGPSVGLIAAALTFLAFWAQYDANIEQKRQFNKSISETRISTIKGQVEGRFFELLKIHIENRNFVTKSKDSIFDDYIDEIQEITFTIETIRSELPNTVTEYDVQDIAYSIFFYGAYKKSAGGDYGFMQVSRIFWKYFGTAFNATSFFEALLKRFKTTHDVLENKLKGHQNLLGHYFRHLFQTVKYINDQPFELFNYNDKYQYIKILRAQLSTAEQILLFYNANSELGKQWEFDEKLDENHKLITKYNLIKNIPVDILKYPRVKKRFPLVFFEDDTEKNPLRSELEEKFYSNVPN